jgi:predicted transcriptional regulator
LFCIRFISNILNRLNRSKHEIISDILSAIDIDGISINRIQLKTSISYQHLKKYLIYLVQTELIIYEKEEKKFRITEQGVHALDMYTKLDELLIPDTSKLESTSISKLMKSPVYFVSFP